MSIKFSKPSAPLNLIDPLKMTFLIITLSFFSAVNPGRAVAQTVEDSASVYKFVEVYQHTFNTRDPLAFSALFSDDADFVMFNLPGIHGRQAIGNWWREYWQSKFNLQVAGRKGTFVLNSIRFLADDIALVNVETKTGGRDSLGAELPVRRARGMWLLQRQDGHWLVAALRGMPTEEDSVELIRSLGASQSLRPQIRAFVSRYEEVFNTHDPDTLSTFYTNDADIVVRNSPLIHGRSAILKWWRAYFAKLRPRSLDRNPWFESMRTLLIIDQIRMMAPNVALINITATAAMRQAAAEATPIRYARATWLVVREANKWKIAALRVLNSEEDHIIRRSGN